MADSNNVPQEAKQLSEDMESSDKETQDKAKGEVAHPDFDKEYDIAMQNENGSGHQSSDSNPVSRQKAEGAGTSGSSASSAVGHSEHSPGDSDPSDYKDMAKDVTAHAEATAKQDDK
ncbi:MAG: hypothetical protein WBA76_03870 [Phormidesmis sp.]